MAQDDGLIQDTKLEDCDILEQIQEMIQVRASVVGLKFAPLDFDHCATLLDKLQLLRDRVYALAPYFINMDYPYWQDGWATFPKMYTTSWHQDWDKSFTSVDELAMDEEHNINKLPQTDTSFTDETMDLYHKYLENLVYWLKKFRYVKALKTWYDKSVQRNWSWQLRWDYTNWKQTNSSTVNGQSSSGEVTEGELRQGGEGTVYQNGPRQIRSEGYLQVRWEEGGFMRKYYDYDWNHPLTEMVEGEHTYHAGRGGNGIPCNLTTANPASYQAELLWFVVPGSNRYAGHSENAGKGWLVKDTQDYLVTDVEHWGSYHTWGPNSEYGAWEWHAVDGSGESTLSYTDFFNGEYKETANYHNVWSTPGYNRRSTKTTVRTNWTPDGTRSAVVENTTEQDTDTNQPYDNSRWKEYFEMQNFGLVTWQEGERPCFSAGNIAPHESTTYHVCDESSVPTPTYQFNWDYPPNSTFNWGVNEESHITLYAYTNWYPILDYGDYIIPEPEEPGE